MDIEAVKYKRNGIPDTHIQWASVTWCCEKIRYAWLTGMASFGDTNFAAINQASQVRLQPLTRKGTLGVIGVPIDFCPYCGTEINVNVEAANVCDNKG
jgi:hypothetical protein